MYTYIQFTERLTIQKEKTPMYPTDQLLLIVLLLLLLMSASLLETNLQRQQQK